ncbi:putative PEP-CTERM system histidine kinase [Marinobacter segnicrescens]|uniref:histidine kinase n=1 Tax=Marinobacter segnicrescens TaxID=430453 RepID=A0A1I0CWA7_9GAMM|nr:MULTISPECIES: XrtA/PEP-CTERM system histidine kinase PrsK [Marinobacter]UZD67492.1 PEP-CTERM system histidine kinase PrsK [Marinobacter sp. AN1]SET24123.1 putative PEP-CTERM system histidine kinase [Marinobacter segnicrescens]
MFNEFGLISHAAATLAFMLLGGLILTRYLRRTSDRMLLFSALLSTLWAGSLVSQQLWGEPSFIVRYLLELLRDSGWVMVLLALLRSADRQILAAGRTRRLLGFSTFAIIFVLFTLAALESLLSFPLVSGKLKLVGQIALSLLGICLVEQIWRNSLQSSRSSIRYLCIGILTLFAYDFFMYTDALLFGQISSGFWDARGMVNALIVPLLGITMINTRKQPVEFQLSRNAMFHVSALVFAGIYLLFAAAGGYYVRVLGGDWGDALQMLFITGALAFLGLLLTSRRFRARLMVFISQNFFDYKYDYREEWLKMTRELANLSDQPPLPERIIRILAGLLESSSGALWVRDEDGNFMLQNTVNMEQPRFTSIDGTCELARFFSEREWIIDLDEYRSDPVRYNLLEIPDPILKFSHGWLLIPMYLGNELYGITLVGRANARVELNWENFDLVRVVARQTCNLLAQADAQNRLSRAMQFEAVSKASAFMVHDLKTLIAQLSLLVRNSAHHRDNPAFIDDMISTTDHAVQKMSNLVDHIRKPAPVQGEQSPLNLHQMIGELATHYCRNQPRPRVLGPSDPVMVRADRDQLWSVLGHLIQNAQDATPPDGEVTLTLKASSDHVVLFIQDTGTGMSEEFIRMQLFKPFESTKGLTGMGIGAYQAREYVRQLGGNIDVTSEPGMGSCFSVLLPTVRLASRTEPADPEPDTVEEPAPEALPERARGLHSP